MSSEGQSSIGGGRSDAGPDDRRDRGFLTSGPFGGGSPSGGRYLGALVWLLFIAFPLLNAIGKHGSLLRQGLIIGGAAVFVATYVMLVLRWRSGRPGLSQLALVAVLLAVAVALTLTQASGWGFLFTYCAACIAVAAPRGRGFYGVMLCAGLAAVTSAIAGADGGTVLGFFASAAGVGLLMVVMSDLRVRNHELTEARAELARMAVAQERERFARDLHDLLGHSLSVIALKAELAGRMLTDRPSDLAAEAQLVDQAAGEVHDLENVARTALSEVRDAVSGYRQPTLEGELAGARMALSAAGIEANVQETLVPLDPGVEAVLAWAVREGATNVIRHSGARHCTFRITTSLTDAGVEVIDDGVGDGGGAGDGAGFDGSPGSLNGATVPSPGERAGNGRDGHGLAGLAERARLLNGKLEAGAAPGGGYRLAVTVPVSHA